MTFRNWIVLIALLLSSGAFADSLVQDFYSKNRYNIKSQSNLNYPFFKNIIESQKLNTIEGTLSYFKEYFPEFFSNYILMYHSRSLQGSSFENPRAILFDRSGHFVFSFNGHKFQKGYYNLEIVHFIESQKRFEFREVEFSPDGKTPPKFSKANPAKCMACHQNYTRTANDPRPNWEPYNVWPGAYGSQNGEIPVSKTRADKSRRRGLDEGMIQLSLQEGEKLADFLDNVRPNHPRYKFLSENFRAKHTTEFTEIIAAPNALRMGRQIAEIDPILMKYLKYPLLGIFQCESLMVTRPQSQWLMSSLAEIGRSSALKSKALNDYQVVYTKDYYSVDISDGLILLLEPFGVSTQDWSMDFLTDGKLSFTQRFGVPAFPKGTANMGYRSAMGFWEGEKLSCAEIREKSEKAMSELFSSIDLNKIIKDREISFEKQQQPLIQRCIRCHESYEGGIPYIPFSNENALANQLNKMVTLSPRTLMEDIRFRLGPYAKGNVRMPMGSVPSTKQTVDLIQYLEALQK